MKQCTRGSRFYLFMSGLGMATLLLANLQAHAELVFPSARVTSSLNVRAAPDSSSAVINRLLPGKAAVLLSTTTYWYEIELPDDHKGYVSKAWSTTQADLRLGAWNIKKLGHGSTKDYPKVAAIINDNFDILTVIEVMQKGQGHPGLDALRQELGASWAGLVTATPRPSTTAGDAEFYAILYRPSAVRPCQDGEPLQYFQDNDGSSGSTGANLFVREPAFACFETVAETGDRGWDFILAAYHATWADGNEDLITEEAKNLSQVFEAMKQSRPGESDLFVAGDFNLTPDVLHDLTPATDQTSGSGSTLNSKGTRTTNLYDHLLVLNGRATTEMIMPATVLDVRNKTSSNKAFYKTVSDHLPIMGRFVRISTDDD